ncbi:MAG: hypothetical protein M3362_24255 [Acidobacteriota bacterium]|nr:hypothetical protein [Acidobacteriota bacterium]
MASHPELETINRDLNFISRALSDGYLDEETIREMYLAVQSARTALREHELNLSSEVEEALAA